MRVAIVGLAAVTLISCLLTVLTIAKYEALRDDIRAACPTAARLDLGIFAPMCWRAGYQETVRE